MAKDVRVVGIKRKEIDQEKLAMAFLLLAKSLRDQQQSEAGDDDEVRA